MEEQVEQTHTKLDDLLIGFQGKCDENLGIYISTLRLYNTNPADFPKQMRDMLIEQIVVKLFSEWERFLENTFICYMLGEKSSKGVAPVRYAMPLDFDHAYRLIQNVNQYPDWSDIGKVLTNANNFFEQGGAFSILNTMKSDLNALKKLRNAIAHTSYRARKDFENLVQGKVGYLPEGITPAGFLVDYRIPPTKNGVAYFEYYITYLKSAADIIVNFSGELS